MYNLQHPTYTSNIQKWCEHRIVYEGGYPFVNKYLRRFSASENITDFENRKQITYPTAHAASSIDDVRNSIYQRLVDVVRTGGSTSYQEATKGNLGGVDLQNSTMDQFMGMEVLPELLLQGRVGVLTEMPDDIGVTLADKGDKHPYFDLYRAEDILYWYPERPINGYDAVLTKELIYPEVTAIDNVSTLLTEELYRFYQRENGRVKLTTWTNMTQKLNVTYLDLNTIPFYIFEIKRALMDNVSKYEIALMNLESADLAYAIQGNFPLYYEFYDQMKDASFNKPPGPNDGTGGVAEERNKEHSIAVGAVKGRRFPKDTDPPGFINPSPETLEVAMKKEDQIKKDIQHHINLNLTTLATRTGVTKAKDVSSLEASLSYMGKVLEMGEQTLAKHWELYEKNKSALVYYPKTYVLKTDQERNDQAKETNEMARAVPSPTFKREMLKDVIEILYRGKKDENLIEKIKSEIEKAETLTADPDTIFRAHEEGLVSSVKASDALGFDGGTEIPLAEEERARRVALIQAAQTKQGELAGEARGVKETEVGQTSSSEEKQGKPKRGPGRKIN